MGYKEILDKTLEERIKIMQSLEDYSSFSASDTGDKIIYNDNGVETVIFKDVIRNFQNSFYRGIQ